MSIIKYSPDALLRDLPHASPVAQPIGEPVSEVAVRSFTSRVSASTRTGVWSCSPGRWRRQITQAEFCVFLTGSATFEPDIGETLSIAAGEAVYFPAGSLGVWTIHEAATKAYVIFDEPK